MLKPQAVGIAWYAREDYDRVLAVMVDGDQLPDTFDEWRVRAIEVEDQLKARGFVVVRAPIRADAFVAWCRQASREAEADARCQFAADFAEHIETDSRPIQLDPSKHGRDDLRRA